MKIFFSLTLFFSTSAYAAKPILFGHLLSQTTEVLNQGHCVAGFIELGCGATDSLTVVMSPFLYINYNTNNVLLRWTPTLNNEEPEGIRDWSFQYGYFKTFDSQNRTYQMEGHSLWITKRNKISDNFIVYAGFNYMYFINEAAPFSLRRIPFKNDPSQSTLTFLNQFTITDRVSFFTEFAILGLNFTYPNYHFGWSTAYHADNWILQFGLSATGLFSFIANSTYNTEYQTYKNTNAYFPFEDSYKMAVSVHPEINFSYFF